MKAYRNCSSKEKIPKTKLFSFKIYFLKQYALLFVQNLRWYSYIQNSNSCHDFLTEFDMYFEYSCNSFWIFLE